MERWSPRNYQGLNYFTAKGRALAATLHVHSLERVPQIGEIADEMQKLLELSPRNKAIPVLVRSLVRPHERGLVVIPDRAPHIP